MTTFVGAGTVFGGSVSSAVLDMPSGVSQDDFLFCYIGHLGAGANSVPSGWALIAEFDSFGDGKNRAIYWKLAGGSEPADYTWGYAASGRTGGVIVAYRGDFDTSDPIDVVSNTQYFTNDTTLRAASMNVSAANSAIIFAGGYHASADTALTHPSSPAAFTEDIEGFGDRENFLIASLLPWTGSGATGDIDGTLPAVVSNFKHAFAVALNPAAGGIEQAITTATETDTALALNKSMSLLTATETDSAIAIGRRKTAAISLASEADQAFSVSSRKAKLIGTAAETDEAFSVTAGGIVQAVTVATETDSAIALGRRKSAQVGTATETDFAFSITGAAAAAVRNLWRKIRTSIDLGV